MSASTLPAAASEEGGGVSWGPRPREKSCRLHRSLFCPKTRRRGTAQEKKYSEQAVNNKGDPSMRIRGKCDNSTVCARNSGWEGRGVLSKLCRSLLSLPSILALMRFCGRKVVVVMYTRLPLDLPTLETNPGKTLRATSTSKYVNIPPGTNHSQAGQPLLTFRRKALPSFTHPSR